jgi:hypothetical protein
MVWRCSSTARHAFGARWVDGPVGSGGDVEVFSIGPTKQLGVNEGGLVVANDPSIAERIRRFATQGHQLGQLDALEMGMNLRMPELSAALALRALPQLDERLAARAALHERYRTAWCDLPLTVPGPRDGERSAHKDSLVFVDDAALRDPLREHLAAVGVATKPYYDPAIPDLTAFTGRVASAERSRDLATRSFAVPIHGRMAQATSSAVTAALRSFPGVVVTGDPVILVGAAAFAEEITDLCRMAGVGVAGWIEGIDPSHVDAAAEPPIVWVDDQAAFEPALAVLPAIGAVARRGIVERLVGEGRSLATLVHQSAVVAPSAEIGPGCVNLPERRDRCADADRPRHDREPWRTHRASHDDRAYAFVGPGANIAGRTTIGEGPTSGSGRSCATG